MAFEFLDPIKRPFEVAGEEISSGIERLGQAARKLKTGGLPTQEQAVFTARQQREAAGTATQRAMGGEGVGTSDAPTAAIGVQRGGDQFRQDAGYIPQAERTPEQQNAAFRQVALQQPLRYAGGNIPAPESRLGAFDASGKRLSVPSSPVSQPSAPGRTVFEQLASMRALREGDQKEKLRKMAMADVSLNQSLGKFLSAASRKKEASKQLQTLEQTDVQRENIAGRLAGENIAAEARMRSEAAKQAREDRQYQLDVAKFGAQEAERMRSGALAERAQMEREAAGAFERGPKFATGISQYQQTEQRQRTGQLLGVLSDPMIGTQEKSQSVMELYDIDPGVQSRRQYLGQLQQQAGQYPEGSEERNQLLGQVQFESDSMRMDKAAEVAKVNPAVQNLFNKRISGGISSEEFSRELANLGL